MWETKPRLPGPRVSEEKRSGQTISRPLTSTLPIGQTWVEHRGSGETEKPTEGLDEPIKIHSSGFDELRLTAPPTLHTSHYHVDRYGMMRVELAPSPLMTYAP